MRSTPETGAEKPGSFGSMTGPPTGPTGTWSPWSRGPARTWTASCCPRSRTPDRSRRWTCCSARSRRRWASRSAGSASRPRSRNARGLMNVDSIAAASPRLETIIFGPADFMASINMKSLVVGEQPPGYPADAYHYILMRILIAARAHDLQAIDGPYLQVRNVRGFREVARRAAALGFDGKWALHPDQIAAANEIFSPSQEDYDHAELILDAYEWCTSEAGGAKGSAMLGDEMIDEASRKMALVIAAKGRAAGMRRTSKFEPTSQG